MLDELQSILQTIHLLNKEVEGWSESLAEQSKSVKDEALIQLNCIHNSVSALRVSHLLLHLLEWNTSQCRRSVD